METLMKKEAMPAVPLLGSAAVRATHAAGATGTAAAAKSSSKILEKMKSILRPFFHRSKEWSPEARDVDGWKPEGIGRITRGYGKPAIAATVGAGAASIPPSLLLASSLKDSTPLSDISPEAQLAADRSTLLGVGAGGAIGGLGSLLYGTLKDRPDLRRDLIATLIGGAAGGAYQILKSASDDIEINVRADMLGKEAVIQAAALAPWLWGLLAAGTAGGVGYDIYSGKQTERRHNEAIDQAKALEQGYANLGLSADKLRRGGGGALVGGAIGGLFSNLIGRSTDKPSRRRDVLSILAGSAIGGLAGVYSA
jgi:hypothetical protein